MDKKNVGLPYDDSDYNVTGSGDDGSGTDYFSSGPGSGDDNYDDDDGDDDDYENDDYRRSRSGNYDITINDNSSCDNSGVRLFVCVVSLLYV